MPIKLELEFVVLVSLPRGKSKFQAAGFLTYFDAWTWARSQSLDLTHGGILYEVVRVYDGEVMSAYRNGILQT